MSGLDLRKRHGALRSNLETERIDLGNEPPLSVDGETGGLVDRRRVSVQWFSGTVLTGLCGAALMSGAVFAALDGETNFATVPERVEAALRGAVNGIAERVANVTRKADRLPPPGEANAARQVIRVSTTSRGSGNREIVRVRPFIRVAGTGERPRCRRRRARRRGLVLDPRSQYGLAAGEDRRGGTARRGARTRA